MNGEGRGGGQGKDIERRWWVKGIKLGVKKSNRRVYVNCMWSARITRVHKRGLMLRVPAHTDTPLDRRASGLSRL